MHVSALRVFVRNIAEAKEFYLQLGLELESYSEEQGFCVFNPGNTKFIVETVADDDPEDEQVLVGRFTGVSFAVDNIFSTQERLQNAGIQFASDPEQQFWGGWLSTFKDPAGNEFQLVQEKS